MIDKLNLDDSDELMIEDGDLIKNSRVLPLIAHLYNLLHNDDLLKA